MSRFFLLVVAGLLLFAAARAGAAESPFLGGFLQESRVVYPLQLGQWQAGAEQRYTEQEEGASINYRDPAQPGALLSVYFYPAGQLAPGQLQQVARQTLDGHRRIGRQSPDPLSHCGSGAAAADRAARHRR